MQNSYTYIDYLKQKLINLRSTIVLIISISNQSTFINKTSKESEKNEETICCSSGPFPFYVENYKILNVRKTFRNCTKQRSGSRVISKQ